MSWDEIRYAKQRLSHEQGTIIKDWGGKLPIALIYPNSYRVAMSNLGIHSIYQLLNSYSDIVCERIFWETDRQNSNNPPISLESHRRLDEFAILAFSITYELDYLHVIQILKASRLPLRSVERNSHHPLIIAGGPCITANPIPISSFIDCLCIGEAEIILPQILPLISRDSYNRDELLTLIAQLPGIYAPQYHSGSPVIRQWVKNLDDFPTHSVITTPDTELSNLYLIEVERGCNWGCSFCLASQIFNPIRFRSVNNLLDQAQHGLKIVKRLGLVGAAVFEHPHIEDLLARLRQIGARFSVSSLRINHLSPGILNQLIKAGSRSIALAPEAGSQRLRDIINKNISEDDILYAMHLVASSGIKYLKLYFMIGLPTETDEDIIDIVKLLRKCKSVIDQHRSATRITLNITPFIPKAGTPFQRSPMALLNVLEQHITYLKKNLLSMGIKIKSESLAWSEIQAVLARGDINTADVLAGIDRNSLSNWRQTVNKYQLDIDYYAHQTWGVKAKLPWSMIRLSSHESSTSL